MNQENLETTLLDIYSFIDNSKNEYLWAMYSDIGV